LIADIEARSFSSALPAPEFGIMPALPCSGLAPLESALSSTPVPPAALLPSVVAILMLHGVAGKSGLAPEGSVLAEAAEPSVNTAAVVRRMNLMENVLKGSDPFKRGICATCGVST
jgi:hypothetical protein